MAAPSAALLRSVRVALFAALLTPLLWLGWAWQAGALGPMPDERLLHRLGQIGQMLLLASLALGPAHRATGWTLAVAVRRQVGLWAFLYLCLHALVWAALDQGWMWAFIAAELAQMRHLQVGLASLLLLAPLAATSFDAALRWLTLPRWRRLHQLAYVAALGGVAHGWLVARFDSPTLWATTVVLALLIALRLWGWVRKTHEG